MTTTTTATFWARRRKAIIAAAGVILTIALEYVTTSTEVVTWLGDYLPANLVPVVPVILGGIGIVLGVHRIPNATAATVLEDAVQAAKAAYQAAVDSDETPDVTVAVAATTPAQPAPVEPAAVEPVPVSAPTPIPVTSEAPFWAGVTATDTARSATSIVQLVNSPGTNS